MVACRTRRESRVNQLVDELTPALGTLCMSFDFAAEEGIGRVYQLRGGAEFKRSGRFSVR